MRTKHGKSKDVTRERTARAKTLPPTFVKLKVKSRLGTCCSTKQGVPKKFSKAKARKARRGLWESCKSVKKRRHENDFF